MITQIPVMEPLRIPIPVMDIPVTIPAKVEKPVILTVKMDRLRISSQPVMEDQRVKVGGPVMGCIPVRGSIIV